MVRLLGTKNLIPLLALTLVLISCEGKHTSNTGSSSTGIDNASLAILSVSSGTLSPSFSTSVVDYTLSLDLATDSLSLRAIPVVEGATIVVENNSEEVSDASNIPLNVGQNTILIKVTALDGVTQKTYSIVIARAVNDASLSLLSVSSGELSPFFMTDVLDYTIDLRITNSKLDLSAIPAVEGATVTIENNAEAVVDPSNVYMALGQNNILIKVTALDGTTQQTYSITATRNEIIAQEAYIKASNADSGDSFGTLALYGNTLVVGANESSCLTLTGAVDGTNNSCASSGMVYVFTRSINGTWMQEAELKASNARAQMSFGWQSVDIYEDTIVVSANYESNSYRGIINVPGSPVVGDINVDTNSYRSGAVYVFVKNPNTGSWYQQAYIKASNSNAEDYFGYDVKLYKDTLAVSAPQEDTIATDSGAIYIFQRTNGVWSQEAFLKASNAGGKNNATGSTLGDNLGRWALAIYENTVVAGSYYEDSNFTGVHNVEGFPSAAESNDLAVNSGAVYVFTKINGVWKQTAFLKGSNTETIGPDPDYYTNGSYKNEWRTGDHFYRVDLYKDTLVVGASGEDSSNQGIFNQNDAWTENNDLSNSGAAYVFERTPGTNDWVQKAYIKSPKATAVDGFGCAVKIYEDTLVIDARYESSDLTGVMPGNYFDTHSSNTNAYQSGALYVYTKDKDGKWQISNYIKTSNPGADDNLGSGGSNNIAIYDGVIAISANNEDSNLRGIYPGTSFTTNDLFSNSGAAYIFY